ncbi:MAG: tRNA (adenosine(37)-N6)-threonylcarbamoyltransferase complex ATPase subunit type 1 TsaE [Gammaproteobacteria bacterium]|nr:tRNA (adenosine(37)-N6)-threonylcarbamoyltransferase complex ATPase subunit type 1 TsaE [Gammaproteobacteria bacterium]
MGEPVLTEELARRFPSEQALADAAADFAVRCRDAGLRPLLIGLEGDLGSGKTTWARAMLRGLGYSGRVPSPTYTLVEQYPVGGFVVAHFDLYRLAGGEELENLGIRDWLADQTAWLLVEWPGRAEAIASACDVVLRLEIEGEAARRLTARAQTDAGAAAIRTLA